MDEGGARLHLAGIADTLIGAARGNISGDASEMTDHARGGNDILIAHGENNFLVGDAANQMIGFARGGDDTLIGDNLSATVLTGDAGASMRDDSRGGNDTLICGDASGNYVRGDAFNMEGNAHGGNDTLISGHGTDYMWGDAEFINRLPASPSAPTGGVVTGADTFVFAPGSGNDLHERCRLSYRRVVRGPAARPLPMRCTRPSADQQGTPELRHAPVLASTINQPVEQCGCGHTGDGIQ